MMSQIRQFLRSYEVQLKPCQLFSRSLTRIACRPNGILLLLKSAWFHLNQALVFYDWFSKAFDDGFAKFVL